MCTFTHQKKIGLLLPTPPLPPPPLPLSPPPLHHHHVHNRCHLLHHPTTTRDFNKVNGLVGSICSTFIQFNPIRMYSGVWLITRCGVLVKFGFNIHDWDHCISSLILLGIFCRLIAFFGMVAFLKK
ncbi:hypothetical protein HYC85_000766 [Camellia sinensis]|uniref:ABC transporter family G domain-containing protein n=1 Tax=Camellia sinensis TaxID=4442 RepID=A0A7J7I4K7_CAMSI|nr:hypothetical protein HYC85_000766 [Camellia sinensis]